jgi:hypothetical protein
MAPSSTPREYVGAVSNGRAVRAAGSFAGLLSETVEPQQRHSHVSAAVPPVPAALPDAARRFGRFSSRVDDRSTSGKLVIGVAFGSTPEWRDRIDVTQPLHQAIGSFGGREIGLGQNMPRGPGALFASNRAALARSTPRSRSTATKRAPKSTRTWASTTIGAEASTNSSPSRRKCAGESCADDDFNCRKVGRPNHR